MSALTLICAAFVGLTPPLASAAEYRLQPGDILDFSVAGVPDLKQRVPVGLDGSASFPLIGEVSVAGLPVAEVREKVKEQLPHKSLTIRSQDGRENLTVISGDEIMLGIAEYRPVYVSGDVSKPGEQPFRAGLSVRQAVSLAGGYDLQRFRMESPILASSELRGEYESLWADFAKSQAANARIRAELDGRKDFDREGLMKAPLAAPVLARIANNEQMLLASHSQDTAREVVHLQKSLAQTDERVKAMTTQFAKENEGAELDYSEIERIADLQKRGVVPITRALETRRLSLLSSTRVLQLGVQIEQAKKDRQDAARQIDRYADERRARLLQELQDSEVALAQNRAKLQATGEKLMYTGVVRSELVRGTGGEPRIVVFRQQGGEQRGRVEADENSTLQPGDTVEVTLKVQYDFKPTQ